MQKDDGAQKQHRPTKPAWQRHDLRRPVVLDYRLTGNRTVGKRRLVKRRVVLPNVRIGVPVWVWNNHSVWIDCWVDERIAVVHKLRLISIRMC